MSSVIGGGKSATLAPKSFIIERNLQGRTRFNRIAAWLALVAVAMLFVAPVISKSLAHQAACAMPHHAMSMPAAQMHHDMPMSVSCENTTPMFHLMSSGHAMSPMEEIACGYCQLIIHLPFVLFALALLLWLLFVSVMGTFQRPPVRARLLRPWYPQCARAPPAAVLFSF